ncbi:hypothetical protein PAECIP111893_02787 [Paenibacillus plantiphilus]|uniref:Extracellular solute-binding protein n=1 Tax=Paenibacillus plantiphilus TaxID=2905650 RepID=A0ABN8GKU9_9BACL|nr:extracellular solute-binding protein [Paenibacillus plantiphilus]CAH1207813.1 hypothetical protein PAECIP111893_02787 [Paenibacillus plantiphilus]
MKEPVNKWERQLAGKPPVNNGFTSDLEHKVRERIRMRQQKKGSAFRAVAALMSIVIILGSGWWFRDDLKEMLNPAEKPPKDAMAELLNDPLGDREIELTVQTMMYPVDFFKKPFIIRHPTVTINELGIEMPTFYKPEKFREAIEKPGQNIDLYMLPFGQFAALAAEGKFLGIGALFKKHNIDLDSYYEPLTELMHLAGDGELYGFPSGYSSNALFVNRKLFEEHGIPLPEEGDSIDEIMDTAARFKGTGVYGMLTGNGTRERSGLFGFATFIGQSNGLKLFSEEGNTMSISANTKGWKEVWQQVSEGYKEGWLGESISPLRNGASASFMQIVAHEMFANGKSAMIFGDGEYYSDLTLYGSSSNKEPMDWITIPYKIDPAATNQAQYLSLPFVYAIDAKSQNVEAAWELLRFIVGEEMASKNNRKLGETLYPGLAANPSAMSSRLEEQWRGFYGMKADPAQVLSESKLMMDVTKFTPQSEIYAFAREQMQAVIDGSKTVEEALSDLQAKADELLTNYNERGAAADE